VSWTGELNSRRLELNWNLPNPRQESGPTQSILSIPFNNFLDIFPLNGVRSVNQAQSFTFLFFAFLTLIL
jgi:hypothetical protein